MSFLFIFLSCNNGKHLKFNGIEIDGNITKFISKMEKKGYTNIGMEGNNYAMSGIFCDEECIIEIETTKKTNPEVVYAVTVMFPPKYNWDNLKSDYNSIKKNISKKYKAEGKSLETFISPYYEGDRSELMALATSHCIYMTTWSLKNGAIILMITTERRILLAYSDKINITLDGVENDKQFMKDI